jgi:hypothetical protein
MLGATLEHPDVQTPASGLRHPLVPCICAIHVPVPASDG